MIETVLRVSAVFLTLGPTAFAAEDAKLLGGGLGDVFEKGGIVMGLIFLGSIVGLALAFERIVRLRQRELLPDNVAAKVRERSESGDLDALETDLAEARGPLARILRAGLQRRAHGREAMEKAMESVGSKEVARLKRPIKPLAVLATIEPLLGLLGTILGMISTFNQLQGTSASDRVETLAPGIGQALYTTAAGLMAAIPFVILYHYLSGRVHRAAEEWSALGSDVVLAALEPTAKAAPVKIDEPPAPAVEAAVADAAVEGAAS